MAQAKQGKVHKFGRHSRAPSNRQQEFRTTRNKRLRKEKAEAMAKKPKVMKVPRGTARRKQRSAMGFTSPAKTQSKTDLAKKFPKFYEASVEGGILPGFSVLGELVSSAGGVLRTKTKE